MSLQPSGAAAPVAAAAPQLALVVPVFNEGRVAPALAERLSAMVEIATEIAVIDGGSSDDTVQILQDARRWPRLHEAPRRFRLSRGPKGRAVQMNSGARGCQADVLVFLHADTEFSPAHCRAIQAAVARGVDFGCFALSIASPDPRLQLASWLITLRSQLMPSATGDQAIFMRRPLFEQLHGYRDQALCEDLDLIKRARGRGRYACLEPAVATSPRRWEQGGVWRTILLMWLLRLGCHAGIDPLTLKRVYQDIR